MGHHHEYEHLCFQLIALGLKSHNSQWQSFSTENFTDVDNSTKPKQQHLQSLIVNCD